MGATFAGVFWNSSAGEIRPLMYGVAPLENRTGDSSYDYVGQMAGEWITRSLATVPAIEVLPFGLLEGQQVEDNGWSAADVVVTGSYVMRGDSIEFAPVLIDARDGRALPSPDAARGPASRLDETIETTSLNVQTTVRFRVGVDQDVLPGAEVVRSPPTHTAYDLFVRANRREEGWDGAERDLHQVIRLDPAFAEAYYDLVIVLVNQNNWAATDSLAQAMAQIPLKTRAHEFAQQYAAAWAAGDRAEAFQASRAMAGLSPLVRITSRMGFTALLANRPREAARTYASLDIDERPNNRFWFHMSALHQAGDYEAEWALAERANRVFPQGRRAYLRRPAVATGRIDLARELAAEAASARDFGQVIGLAREARVHGERTLSDHFALMVVDAVSQQRPEDRHPFARFHLYQALTMLGQADEALAFLNSARGEFADSLEFLGRVGAAHARAGQRDSALAVSRRIGEASRQYRFGRDTLWRARIAALLGDREEALALLSSAFAQGLMIHPNPRHSVAKFDWPGWWHADVDLQSLWGDPEYERIVGPKG